MSRAVSVRVGWHGFVGRAAAPCGSSSGSVWVNVFHCDVESKDLRFELYLFKITHLNSPTFYLVNF